MSLEKGFDNKIINKKRKRKKQKLYEEQIASKSLEDF